MEALSPENPCFPCINCCSGKVKVSDEDMERWKNEENIYVLLSIEEESEGSRFLIHTKDDKCIFLKDNQCSIYETRPEVCRQFPKNRNHAIYFGCKFKNKFEKE